MLLFIDTSDFNNLHLALIDNKKSELSVAEFRASVAFNENYKTNALLEKFLIKQKVKLKNLSKIVVCSGPGSFTGIRVGVSLAQALSFALSIPMIAIPKSKIPKDLTLLLKTKAAATSSLNYGQKPNISKPKK